MNNRQQMAKHVDVLVEEPSIDRSWGDSLFLVQDAGGRFAIVRYGWDIDPMAPTAEEALQRAVWFRRADIAKALVTTNVRPLPSPERWLSFLGACAAALDLYTDERTAALQQQLSDLGREFDEPVKHLERMTPKAKHARQANGYLNRMGARG